MEADHPQERFLSKLTQRYALNSVLYSDQDSVSEQRRSGRLIELVVTRWDA